MGSVVFWVVFSEIRLGAKGGQKLCQLLCQGHKFRIGRSDPGHIPGSRTVAAYDLQRPGVMGTGDVPVSDLVGKSHRVAVREFQNVIKGSPVCDNGPQIVHFRVQEYGTEIVLGGGLIMVHHGVLQKLLDMDLGHSRVVKRVSPSNGHMDTGLVDHMILQMLKLHQLSEFLFLCHPVIDHTDIANAVCHPIDTIAADTVSQDEPGTISSVLFQKHCHRGAGKTEMTGSHGKGRPQGSALLLAQSLHGTDLLQHPFGVHYKAAAYGGQLHTFFAAGKKLRTQLVFQLLDGSRQTGLGKQKIACGFTDGLGVCHLHHMYQLFQLQRTHPFDAFLPLYQRFLNKKSYNLFLQEEIEMFDILIRGGRIIDGTGAPAFAGDVAIKDGKLTVFPGGTDAQAKAVVDATGKCVCPGFIDAHSHADLFFVDPLVHNTAKASQGVTAEVAGQCGLSDFPTRSCDAQLYARHKQEQSRLNVLKPEQTDTFAGYRKYIESVDKATHIKQLVGHGCIRRAVMGSENRAPTDAELEMMKDLLREAMENGAAGLSSGLTYPPGVFTPKAELVELCKVVAAYGGVYTTHMRDEGNGVLDSIRETLDTALEAGCRLNISHLKAAGVPNWGKSEKILAMIEEAAAKGLDVAYDVYPFTASMTSLQSSLPPHEHTFTREERTRRLKDPAIRTQIKQDLLAGKSVKYSALRSMDDVLLVDCPVTVQYRGMTVAQVARERGIDPVDALLDVLAENECATNSIYFTMSEEDLTAFYMHERAMVCTDGLVHSLTESTHPRGFCAFPQAIDLFVRKKQCISLEKAIYKMTAFPARWHGFANKGQLKNGFDADVLIFDPETIAPGFTYGENVRLCTGIEQVFVNGVLTYENGALTGAYPGRFIPHNQKGV